jgi:hypothetical protein
MLTNYKIIVQVSGYLHALSKALQTEAYPVEIYRNYRLVYEGVNRLAGRLHGYKSNNHGFIEAREIILSEKDREAAKPSIAVIEEPASNDKHPNHDDGQSSNTDSLDMQLRRVSEPTTMAFSNHGKSKMEADIRILEQRMKEDNEEFVR